MKDDIENLGLPTRGLNPRLQRSRPAFLPLDHSAAHVSKGNLATLMQVDHVTSCEVYMLPAVSKISESYFSGFLLFFSNTVINQQAIIPHLPTVRIDDLP